MEPFDCRSKSVFPDNVCWQTFHNNQERLAIVRERLSRYPNASIRNLPYFWSSHRLVVRDS